MLKQSISFVIMLYIQLQAIESFLEYDSIMWASASNFSLLGHELNCILKRTLLKCNTNNTGYVGLEVCTAARF
jgi:hypothetical protein